MYRSICLSFLGALGLLVLGCSSSEAPSDLPSEIVPGIAPLEVFNAPVIVDSPAAGIREIPEGDLSRIRDQHSRLIETIPTPSVLPTHAPAQDASVYILTGDDPSSKEDKLVSDPSLGIWWYRKSGGDWSTRQVRDMNPYSPLVYGRDYEPEHASFNAGTMQELVAQKLVAGG